MTGTSSSEFNSSYPLLKAISEDFHPLETLENGLKSYGMLLILGWITFEILRYVYPATFYTRDRSIETTCDTVKRMKEYSIFQWILPIYFISNDTILTNCGLDTLMFLRFLRLCQKVALGVILLSLGLFPVYYYAPEDPDSDINDEKAQGKLDPLYRMTLSNLPSENHWRFTFPVIALYIISIWTCFLLWKEYKDFTQLRHDFTSRLNTMQYSVIINELPQSLRTRQTLREYLEVLYPGNVLHIHVALECSDLEQLQSERVKIRNTLEHVLATANITGVRPQVRDKLIGGKKVDAIKLYESYLRSLNLAVAKEIQSVTKREKELANSMLKKIEVNESKEEGKSPTMKYFNSDTDVVIDMADAKYLEMLKGKFRRNKSKSSGIMRGTAFVTFSSLKSAQAATQVLPSADPTVMRIDAAPHVDDVIWENVGAPMSKKSSLHIASITISIAIMLFWAIPTSFIVSLSQISNLKNKWPWLAKFVQDHPYLAPGFEQLSPLLLSTMASIAPIIFGILSEYEGHDSKAAVQTSLLRKLMAYQWFHMLLLPILFGTLLQTITGNAPPGKSITNINYLMSTISKAMPAQSSFFMTYILVLLGIILPMTQLRLIPLIKAMLYHMFAPKHTTRERSSPWYIFRPMSVPGAFFITDVLAMYYLVFLLCLVFCSIAPIISYVGIIFFFLSDVIFRWVVLCVTDPSPHSTGMFFPILYNYCILALAFSQVVMAVLMGTKRAPFAATSALLLPFGTFAFHMFITSTFPRLSLNLPLDEAVKYDLERNTENLNIKLIDVYKQPALSDGKPIHPEEEPSNEFVLSEIKTEEPSASANLSDQKPSYSTFT